MAGAPPNDSVKQEPLANNAAVTPPNTTNKIFKMAEQTGYNKCNNCTRSSNGHFGAAKGHKAATPQLQAAFKERLGKAQAVTMAYTATIERRLQLAMM